MSRKYGLLLFVLIAVLCCVAAFNAYWFAHQFPDEVEYWTLAKNLAQTGMLSFDGVTPSAYRPPLLAWILTPIAATGTSLSVARVFFVVFFGASGVLSALFFYRTFPRQPSVAAIGTVFVLCNPVYLFSAGNLYPQQILTPLLLAALFCACSKPTSSSRVMARSVLIGGCTAASLLAAASSLFSLIPIWLVLCAEDFRAIRKGVVTRANRVILAAAVVVVFVSPYLYRNCRNVHHGIYLTLNSGINLLVGNSPNTTPHSGVDVNLSGVQEKIVGESEFDANQRLTKAAAQNIKADPGHYGKLYFRKFLAGFSNMVVTVTHGYNQAGTVLFQAYMTVVWAGIALLVVFHLRRVQTNDPAQSTDWGMLYLLMWLVLAAYLFNLAGYAVFFNRLRFRIPLDVALSLVSAAGWAVALVRAGRLLQSTERVAAQF